MGSAPAWVCYAALLTHTDRSRSQQPTYLILAQSPALVAIRERRLDHISLAGDRP